MPTAYTQEIISSQLSDEFETIKSTYQVNESKIEYFLQIDSGPGDTIILLGFFQVKKGPNLLYISSAAISGTSSGALTINIPFLKGSIHIKHSELNDLKNGPNLLLKPQRLQSPSPVDVVYYVDDSLLLLRDSYFPSPPATGSFS